MRKEKKKTKIVYSGNQVILKCQRAYTMIYNEILRPSGIIESNQPDDVSVRLPDYFKIIAEDMTIPKSFKPVKIGSSILQKDDDNSVADSKGKKRNSTFNLNRKRIRSQLKLVNREEILESLRRGSKPSDIAKVLGLGYDEVRSIQLKNKAENGNGKNVKRGRQTKFTMQVLYRLKAYIN